MPGYLAGSPGELGLQIPTNPPGAVEYPDSRRHPVLPRLEYLEIADFKIGNGLMAQDGSNSQISPCRLICGRRHGSPCSAVRTAFCSGRAGELALLVIIHVSAISIVFRYLQECAEHFFSDQILLFLLPLASLG